MRILVLTEGKYSTIQLSDGKLYFISVRPKEITIHPMKFFIIPGRAIWKYCFPFFIRSSSEAWDLSKKALQIILNSLEKVETSDELIDCLENRTKMELDKFVAEKCGIR